MSLLDKAPRVHSLEQPPAASTVPSGSEVANARARPTLIESLVTLQVPVAGLYSSELARDFPDVPGELPPASRTLPPGSRVAVGATWAIIREPVAVQRLVAGL